MLDGHRLMQEGATKVALFGKEETSVDNSRNKQFIGFAAK